MEDNNAIAHITNPATGEVTLYLRDVKGGPVISGRTLTEAMTKWQEAFALYQLAEYFCERDPSIREKKP